MQYKARISDRKGLLRVCCCFCLRLSRDGRRAGHQRATLVDGQMQMQLCCVTTHDLLVERKEQSRPESALTPCISFIAMAVGRCMKACFTAQPLAACHCREHICSTAGQQRIHIRLTVAVLTKCFTKEVPACHCQLSVPCASFFGDQTAASLFTC